MIRKPVTQTMLSAELLRRLPFQAEFMICRSRDVMDLVGGEAFSEVPSDKDISRFVTILAKRPRTLPPFPINQPAGDDWQVKVIGVSGRFVLSLYRRLGRRLLYPNEVVEKNLGVSATTRNWNTIAAICGIMKGT